MSGAHDHAFSYRRNASNLNDFSPAVLRMWTLRKTNGRHDRNMQGEITQVHGPGSDTNSCRSSSHRGDAGTFRW